MGNELDRTLREVGESLNQVVDAFDSISGDMAGDADDSRGDVPLGGRRLLNRGSLLTELRRYDQDDVAIPVDKMRRAKEVVEHIKRSFQTYVRGNHFNFSNIIHQGSVYEGLKVIEPDEFDLLLPLMLNDSEWRLEEADNYECQAPGYYFIQERRGNDNTYWNDCIVNDICLSPIKVGRKMQSVVQKYVRNITLPDGISFTLRESGPALMLEVRYDNLQRMSIDIVPSIEIRGRMFVAKRHLKADPYQSRNRNEQNMYNHIWRESFSEQEKSVIQKMDRMNECRRTCLKILKTIRKKRGSSQLGMLRSYHLKTCMLHLNADSIGSWHLNNLDDRFKDLLRKLIQFLTANEMPSFFAPRVNLFRNFNRLELQNIEGWLSRIIRSDDKIIDELLSNSNTEASAANELVVYDGGTDHHNPSGASEGNVFGTVAAVAFRAIAVGAIGYGIYSALNNNDEGNAGAGEGGDAEDGSNQPVTLLMMLRQYYDLFGNIPAEKQARIIEIQEDVRLSFESYIKENHAHLFKADKVKAYGGSCEGLQVTQNDIYEMMVPLKLDETVWSITAAKATLEAEDDGSDDEWRAPGYYFIKKSSHVDTNWDDCIVGDLYLCPIKVRRKIQSIVEKAIDNMNVEGTTTCIYLHESGPSLGLEIKDTCLGIILDIFFYPSIELGSKTVVSKRHPKADQYNDVPYGLDQNNMYNHIWLESFSEKEKSIFCEMDGELECRRVCLKILKAKRLHGSCKLVNMSSYHLKTCMLHLNADESIGPWHKDNLDDRFKDLLGKLIQFLTANRLPNFFDPSVDLLEPYDVEELMITRHVLSEAVLSDTNILRTFFGV